MATEENQTENIEETSEETEEGAAEGGIGQKGSIASPEGIIMMCMGGLFDLVGLLGFIPVIGWIIELISDIIAAIFFSIWMLVTKRKGWWKFFLGLILEAIPYIDDVAPFISLIGIAVGAKLPTSWIGFVYAVL
ncbi:MAG: hypothetical protein ABSF55_00530 [Candidatus Staskawiczbacteria bacterium]